MRIARSRPNWIAIACLGVPGGCLFSPFAYLASQYLWPPTVLENDEMAEIVLYTPKRGPLAGAIVDEDGMFLRPNREPAFTSEDLRPIGAAEFRKALGERFRGQWSEAKGQGELSYEIEVDHDVLRVERLYENDKYVYDDRCDYRLIEGRPHFLRRTRYDRSWPNRR